MTRGILSRPAFTALLALALLASLSLPVSAGPQGEVGPNGAVVVRQELAVSNAPSPHFGFASLLQQATTNIVKTIASAGGVPVAGGTTSATVQQGQDVTFFIDVQNIQQTGGTITIVDTLDPGLLFNFGDACSLVTPPITVGGVVFGVPAGGGQTVVCTPPANNPDFVISATVSPNATVGSTLRNTAQIQSGVAGTTFIQSSVTVTVQAAVNTPTATVTGTVSPTVTGTVSPTVTGTVSPTVTGTVSPTATPTQTQTPSPTPVGASSVAFVPVAGQGFPGGGGITFTPAGAGQTTATITNPSGQTITISIPLVGGGTATLTAGPGTTTQTFAGTPLIGGTVTVTSATGVVLATGVIVAGITPFITLTPTPLANVVICIQTGSVDLFSSGGFGGFGGNVGNLLFSGNSITGNMGGLGNSGALVVQVPTSSGTQSVNLNNNFSGTFTGTFSGNLQQGGTVTVTLNGSVIATGTIVCDVLITPGFNQGFNQGFLPPPPLQFLPPPPPPLLPPPPPAPMGAQQPAATMPMGGIPIIPEADSLFLLVGGLAALGGLVGYRSLRRRQDDDVA